MTVDQRIIARPFIPDIIRDAKPSGLRWRDVVFVLVAGLARLLAGTLLLCGAIWAFAAIWQAPGRPQFPPVVTGN